MTTQRSKIPRRRISTGLPGTHLMTTETVDAVLVGNHRLAVLDPNCMGGAAFGTFAASNAVFLPDDRMRLKPASDPFGGRAQWGRKLRRKICLLGAGRQKGPRLGQGILIAEQLDFVKRSRAEAAFSRLPDSDDAGRVDAQHGGVDQVQRIAVGGA